MEGETQEQLSSEYEAGDAVIDTYIKNLQETKADPKKKAKFLEEYYEQKKAKEEPQDAHQDVDPLDQVEFTKQRQDNSSNDSNDNDEPIVNRRVIPHGDPDKAAEELERAENEPDSDEDSKSKKKGKEVIELSQFDPTIKDDAQLLAKILKDNVKSGGAYVIKNYFKRSYSSTTKSARYLNQLLTTVGVQPRMRRIILDSFFEISQKTLDLIFQEAEEDDDEKSSSRDQLPDADELIDYPVLLPNGNPATKADGSVITMKMKMSQVRAMIMRQQLGGLNGRSDDPMEIAREMIKIQSGADKSSLEQEKRWTEFYRQGASRDTVKDLLNDKERLKALGLVGDVERPSQYQKEVISEVRVTGKEFINETKSEVRPLFDMFREDFASPFASYMRTELTKPTGDPVKDAANAEAAAKMIKPVTKVPNLDEAMEALQQAAVAEISKGPKKKI